MQIIMKIIQGFLLCIFTFVVLITGQLTIKNNIQANKLTATSEALMHIIKTCKKDYDAIFISAYSNENNQEWLKNLQADFSVIINYNLTKYNSKIIYTKKIDAFILIIDTMTSLKNIIIKLQSMIWWNVFTPVYVVNVLLDGCKNSEPFLQIMWNHTILTSYILCSNSKNEIFIYTYNPYSNRAPIKWNLIKSIGGSKKDYWTFYNRKYIKNSGEICQDFDFDRTQFLNGSEMTVASMLNDPLIDVTGETCNYNYYLRFREFFYDDVAGFIDYLALLVNIRSRIYFHSETTSSKKYKNSRELFVHDIYVNSSSDIIFVPMPLVLRELLDYEASYPILVTQFGIVTYHRGYLTPVEKIQQFYGIWILLFTIFIILITFIVIWYAENRGFAFTIFEIIRLVINHNLQTRINTLFFRMFFSIIFIYFLVIQATFNGQLSKFLTKPELRKHAETINDLKDLGYTNIYNYTRFKKDILGIPEDTVLGYQLIAKKCIEHILNNDRSAVCVHSYLDLYKYMHPYKKLYINKIPFGVQYGHYILRKQWPLKNRITKLFIHYWDLGFRNYIERTFFKGSRYNYKLIKSRSEQSCRPIKLKDLKFIFVILGIGLFTAIFIFCSEVLIYQLFKLIPMLNNVRNLVQRSNNSVNSIST